MKKIIGIYVLIISMIMPLIPLETVYARALTTEEMKVKISELRNKYKQDDNDNGEVWYGGRLSADTCMGFAVKVSQFIFGEDCRNWYVHGNVNDLCVGDHVRYRSSYWNHSITVIDIVGDTVYFIDCNGTAGSNKVGYSSMTKQELANKINQKVYTPDCEYKRNGLGYIQTQPDNWVKTLGGDTIVDNGSKWRVTATDGINLRNGAGIGYSKVGAIAYNTYFYITERKQADGYVWGKTDAGWLVLNYADHVSGPVPDIQTDEIESIHKDSIPHVRNGYCTIKNVSSGKFLNVYAGNDANYTSVCMWEYDDSTDQHFRLDHKGDGKYMLYAYCSSRGTNRVIDVNRGTDEPAEGDKVQLWTPDDDTSQLYYLWPVGNDEYVFELASKSGYVIAPNGSGDAGSDGAQLILQRYTGEAHQKWKFCDNNGDTRVTNISYAPGYYTVNTRGTRIVRRNAPDPYSEVLSGHDINDGETVYVSQVNDFWGYTDSNGIGGWICLDYTKSTVVLESISIISLPDKTSYFVGEQFDSLGLKISAHYSNGQSEELTSGFTTSADFSTHGNKNVTVSYKGKTTSFSVNVENITVSELTIQETIIKKKYNVGETLDTTGLLLVAVYNNGKTALIDSGFSADYDFSSPGTKSVTVSYGGKTISYEVEVAASTEPSKTASLSVVSQNGYSGSNVTVPIKLSAEDIYDGNMTIQYDTDKLAIDDVQAVGELKDRQVIINKEYSTDKIRVSFSGTSLIDSEGAILNLKFNILDNAQGIADISITEARAYNQVGGSVPLTLYAGSVQITTVANNVAVTNIQSVSRNGKKIVTANVSDDNVMCYFATYKNGALIECDAAQPLGGSVELSVNGGADVQYKFMTWNMAMKPMINTINIY